MHWFSSIYTALIKTFSVSRIVVLSHENIVQYSFVFHFLQFFLLAEKQALEIKRFSRVLAIF